MVIELHHILRNNSNVSTLPPTPLALLLPFALRRRQSLRLPQRAPTRLMSGKSGLKLSPTLTTVSGLTMFFLVSLKVKVWTIVRCLHLKWSRQLATLWEAKQYEVNGQLSVVMEFTHDDDLSKGYDGECPTKWDAATETRVPVTLNALATIGSNDFRYFVMKGDEWISPHLFLMTASSEHTHSSMG